MPFLGSLPSRKVLGFSHHVVLRSGERNMRRCGFIILRANHTGADAKILVELR